MAPDLSKYDDLVEQQRAALKRQKQARKKRETKRRRRRHEQYASVDARDCDVCSGPIGLGSLRKESVSFLDQREDFDARFTEADELFVCLSKLWTYSSGGGVAGGTALRKERPAESDFEGVLFENSFLPTRVSDESIFSRGDSAETRRRVVRGESYGTADFSFIYHL